MLLTDNRPIIGEYLHATYRVTRELPLGEKIFFCFCNRLQLQFALGECISRLLELMSLQYSKLTTRMKRSSRGVRHSRRF